MARDDAMLVSVGEATSPPTMRLYQWSQPTISLGYFQRFSDFEALPPPAGNLAVVRRMTGGGAILHDWELTYSIALPVAHDLLQGGANRIYELAHDAVIASLADLELHANRCGVSDDSGAARGPFFCFERRHCYDVLLGSAKIAGSAQRRTRHAILQHGSIVLGNRFAQQPTALAGEALLEARIGKARSAFSRHFQTVFGKTNESGWTAHEQERAEELVRKYLSDEWMRRS